MSTYADLGVRRLINAYGTTTVHGGTRMSPGVLAAMCQAAQSFVDLRELHEKAGRRVAEFTGNEAACITSGAAAGLLLAAAACMAGSDVQKLDRLPDSAGMRNEIIVKASQQIAWTVCARLAGARIVPAGSRGGAEAEDLERAITGSTAAILWFEGVFEKRDGLPLGRVIEIARRHGVPVIVDAAAQLPPKENLWRFTQMGADLVVFSGGKGLRGPQCSGLVVGRRELIAACAENASPNCRAGRACKIGKEEIMGLVTAVEEFVEADHEAIRQRMERRIRHLADSLNDLPQLSVSAARGEFFPVALVSWSLGPPAQELLAALGEGDPAIAAREQDGGNGIRINPFNLEEPELAEIIERLHELFA